MAQRRRQRPQRLGDVLLAHGLITRQQRRAALEKQKSCGKRLGEILVEDGILTPDELNWALGNLLGIPYVELSPEAIDPEAFALVPYELLERYRAVPMLKVGNELTVAMADPTDTQAVADIAAITGAEIKLAMADASAIEATLAALAPAERPEERPTVKLPKAPRRAPSTEELLADPSGAALVEHHLRQAHQQGADELVFQPAGDQFRVRYRVHGRLVHGGTYPASFLPNVITRLKLMARLDLEAGVLFQEGQVPLEIGGKALEVTASVYNTVHGPGARIRIRAKRAEAWPLRKLGFDAQALECLRRAVASGSGLVVVCGPRRSGCSTTLYALLAEAASPERHVVTLQGFTTCRFPDATQLEVPHGPDYLAVLGSVAEQAPDVVLAEGLHERDFWSAFPPEALTTTLLLGEMRAEDTFAALNLLREAGVSDAVLASSLRVIVAQRLVPRLDPHAREPHAPPDHVLDRVAFLMPEAATGRYYKALTDPDGRKVFRGLELLYEVLEPTDEVRDLLLEGASGSRLREAVAKAQLTTLRRTAVAKAARGLVELEEAL